MHPAYLEGFIEKCAEAGITDEAQIDMLLKLAHHEYLYAENPDYRAAFDATMDAHGLDKEARWGSIGKAVGMAAAPLAFGTYYAGKGVWNGVRNTVQGAVDPRGLEKRQRAQALQTNLRTGHAQRDRFNKEYAGVKGMKQMHTDEHGNNRIGKKNENKGWGGGGGKNRGAPGWRAGRNPYGGVSFP